jgi:transposase InsO family protein
MISIKAEQKYKAIKFCKKYGLKATLEAFEISRRTLFYWQAQLQQGRGKPEVLNEKSKRPRKVRTRNWPFEVIAEIKRLRKEHKNLGKEKINMLLKFFCTQRNLPCPSARTIGRIIANAPDKMRAIPTRINAKGKRIPIQKSKILHKPKGFLATFPGHCLAFDSIEKHINGCRRYVITCIDLCSRFAFSWATTSHASEAARQFFLLLLVVFPYRIYFILTDGGSEFKKNFSEELKKQYYIHWHTYPRTPKMNAHCERFNRTIQEEFLNYHHEELLDDIDLFNDKMIDYLLWYNGERPHWALGLKSPIQYLAQRDSECNMWWPNT